MNEDTPKSPTPDVLKEQFKELNNRSRWYSGQLWYIPFAYFGLVALALSNVIAKDPRYMAVALLACGAIGVFVFWHMCRIRHGERRAVENLQKVEENLNLERTAEIKGYTVPFFVAVPLIFSACLLVGAILFGCIQTGKLERLELTATALSNAADECLLDVRDRKLKYDKSPNCISLGALAKQYIDAGGFQTDTPGKYALIAAEARVTAWTARAVSESGNPLIRIW